VPVPGRLVRPRRGPPIKPAGLATATAYCSWFEHAQNGAKPQSPSASLGQMKARMPRRHPHPRRPPRFHTDLRPVLTIFFPSVFARERRVAFPAADSSTTSLGQRPLFKEYVLALTNQRGRPPPIHRGGLFRDTPKIWKDLFSGFPTPGKRHRQGTNANKGHWALRGFRPAEHADGVGQSGVKREEGNTGGSGRLAVMGGPSEGPTRNAAGRRCDPSQPAGPVRDPDPCSTQPARCNFPGSRKLHFRHA